MSNWGGKRAGAGRKKIQDVAFEGGQDDFSRTWVYMPESADLEMPEWTRRSLLKKARWLYNNAGLPARAIDGVARYTVGKGISVQARTTNRGWNQTTEKAFEITCGTDAEYFDVAGQVNFYEAQQLILKQILTDGDFFAQLMLSSNQSGMTRFIAGEYCGSPFNDKEFNDGVKVDFLGKPTDYKFILDSMAQMYQVVPADDILHFKRIHRHGFVRGVSALRHAINHLHDMTDILKFTKGSFKLASQIAFILESPEAGSLKMGASVMKMTQGAGEVTHDRMYPLAGHVQMKPGERLTSLKNEHPGESFDPFMNFLARDISWGIGVSPEILWAIAGVGGANTRYVLADAQTFWEELQALLVNRFCRKFYLFWLWQEIKSGRIPFVEDWQKHEWLPPGRMTVDFTKDGKLLADLCDRGLLSPDLYYGMQGLDAESQELDVIRRRARRKVQVAQVAAEEGVELTVEECFPPPPGSTNVNQPNQQNQAN